MEVRKSKIDEINLRKEPSYLKARFLELITKGSC